MQRYFIEVAYNGANYSGFQTQENAITVQQKVEEALQIFFKQSFILTGSSRTDAGVHAYQNFFHFDATVNITPKIIYNLNAILPQDITVKSIYPVSSTAHCRFDALSRKYRYCIHQQKNPFLQGKSWFYPFAIDVAVLHEAASVLKKYTNFEAFSKKHTQVKTFDCTILQSEWLVDDVNQCLYYEVAANRFLRGMVKGLVSTMLFAAKGKITLAEFEQIVINRAGADFTAPSEGLFLCEVQYPEGLLNNLV